MTYQVQNFRDGEVLPKGEKGEKGDKGDKGDTGISALGGKYTSDDAHPNKAGYERFYMKPIAVPLKRL